MFDWCYSNGALMLCYTDGALMLAVKLKLN